MKTRHSGVSAGNIHINQLANLAKSHFLPKLFYIFFMLFGVQLAYADQAAFNFLYGIGVESMKFNYNSNGSTAYTVTTSAESSQLIVNVQAKNFSGSSGQANVFNSTYGPHKMGLGTNDPNANNTDILVAGPLIINGNPIDDNNFALAHEHKSNNWWIATNSGFIYNSQPFSFEVQDSNGKHYCLLQNYTNFQITVVSGACQQNQLTQLLVNWDKSIEGATFTYDGRHDAMYDDQDYLQTVYSGPTDNSRQIAVNVYSQLEPSSDIAQSFINLFSYNFNFSYDYYTSFLYGGSPSLLDYYIRGSLHISDKDASKSVTIPDFTIGLYQDPSTLQNVFWIGSSTSFTQQTGVTKLPLHCTKFTAPNVINIYAPNSKGNC